MRKEERTQEESAVGVKMLEALSIKDDISRTGQSLIKCGKYDNKKKQHANSILECWYLIQNHKNIKLKSACRFQDPDFATVCEVYVYFFFVCLWTLIVSSSKGVYIMNCVFWYLLLLLLGLILLALIIIYFFWTGRYHRQNLKLCKCSPCMFHFLSCNLSFLNISSRTKLNSFGEITSPCLTPLFAPTLFVSLWNSQCWWLCIFGLL